MYRYWKVLLATACIILTTGSAFASVSGTVVDTQGNPVVGALFTLINDVYPDVVSQAVTNSQGEYVIQSLPTSVEDDQPAPFTLGQNYPNPFNPATTIPFSLDKPGHVALVVYSSMGQRIRTLIDSDLDAGEHTVTWNGSDDTGRQVAAGMYMYRLMSGGGIASMKMMLIDGGAGAAGNTPAGNIASRAEKTAADQAFRVTITGDDIRPYEHPNVIVLRDGDTVNFIVARFVTIPYELQLIDIPGGTYQMGSTEFSIEVPVHTVTVSGFKMSKYETTCYQYVQYLNEAYQAGDIKVEDVNVIGVTGEWSGNIYYHLDGFTTYSFAGIKILFEDGVFSVKPGYENWPVTWVNWFGAKAFCAHFGYDLPTEAEWEYACRSGLGYRFGTDDGTLSLDKANYLVNDEIGLKHPVAVGSYSPNPFGLYDMSGNAWEMCNDWLAVYSAEDQTNPTGPDGPAEGSYKIVRGGVWYWSDFFCRAAHREACPPEGNGHGLSFRVVVRQ